MQNVATIKLVESQLLGEFYFRQNQIETAKTLRDHGKYGQHFEIDFAELGEASHEDILEEVFDLTNNPGRQDERVARYGRGRSVSVGDLVAIDGTDYVCMSMGWSKVD
jgi:hypothetical protein